MTKMIFEDNDKMAISKLIARAYYDDCATDKDILFAGNNSSITDLLVNLDINYNYLVYVDVVPDNIMTIYEYLNCIKYIKENNFTNVFILPIPCIEYYVIDAFIEDELYRDLIFNKSKYKDYTINKRNKKLSVDSFEKYCKSMLYNSSPCMDKNKQFYKEDCICKKAPFNEKCNEMNLDYKAWRLVGSLPVIAYSDRNKYIKARQVNINEVVDLLKEEYYKLANKYVEYGYIKTVVSLELNYECKEIL